ncbi:MAG: hypothetical protein VKO21_01505 [Candidatus Sericytochromatia bacterium]|nr:hypothetical protein [Candidatus Sericytochromatia bacterium]
MLLEVLKWVAARDGARLTEIRSHFGLSAWMAGTLVVQLQDAGWLNDPVLGVCHHLGPDANSGSCGNCAGGGCSSQKALATDHADPLNSELAFMEGCCGMNQPYVVTRAGEEALRSAPTSDENEVPLPGARASAEEVQAAWVARAQARARSAAD